MHMADALVSPAVGGTMWAATAVTTAYCAKRVRKDADDAKIPLMGVTGAFVFAAQMLNFTIPGTGASGHLGGGLILAILLGPEAAFLVIASVLTVQAFFFADGGLLALGANIFNLGFFPAFVAFPFVYRKIAGARPGRGRLFVGAVAGALAGLCMGALGVVLQTTASGISELPFATFLAVMLPIHVAIGLVEGVVTAGVVSFVREAQPEILGSAVERVPLGSSVARGVLAGLVATAVVAGGVLSWFASSSPDGLEWSVARVTGTDEFGGDPSGVKDAASSVQARTAILPDYGSRQGESGSGSEATRSRPGVDPATSTAGLVGGAITLLFAAGAGLLLTLRARRADE